MRLARTNPAADEHLEHAAWMLQPFPAQLQQEQPPILRHPSVIERLLRHLADGIRPRRHRLRRAFLAQHQQLIQRQRLNHRMRLLPCMQGFNDELGVG